MAASYTRIKASSALQKLGCDDDYISADHDGEADCGLA